MNTNELNGLIGADAPAFSNLLDNPITCTCSTGAYGHHPDWCDFWEDNTEMGDA